MQSASAILVVEDDELVQEFLCRALAGLADTVDACSDGASALRAVAARSYGLILLDGLLPDIHGIEIGKQLLANPATRLSALCLVSGSLRFARSPRDGIAALPKPLRMVDLIATAEEMLAWSRSAATQPSADRSRLDAARADTLAAVGTDLLVR